MAVPKSSWATVKKTLSEQSAKELIKLVGELYSLNPENRQFLETRFSNFAPTEILETCKKQLTCALYPKGDNNPNFRIARRVIANYRKAKGDDEGLAELMIVHVETANQFTLDFGDMWEQFYISVENMFDDAVKHVTGMEKKGCDIAFYKQRLRKVVDSTSHIGWGYHDGLAASFHQGWHN